MWRLNLILDSHCWKTEILGRQYFLPLVQNSWRTCDDAWVYIEGIIGWVNASPLVVVLAEEEGAAIHVGAVDVRIASDCGLW